MPDISAFKAYDIRGRVGTTLDEAFAYALGSAVCEVLDADHVVIGRDVRPSSLALSQALWGAAADKERARTLARQAREDVKTIRAFGHASLDEADRWIQEIGA